MITAEWERALLGPAKRSDLCRVAGCEAAWTHVERDWPDLLDSRRCATHADADIHVRSVTS